MQRPSVGYRGGARVGHHYSHNHRLKNDDDDHSSLSNSDSDGKIEQNPRQRKHSSAHSKPLTDSDFESAIRNLRPAVTHQKKAKTNLNISKQKADLPQLNTTNGDNHRNDSKHEQIPFDDPPARQWFPKADVGHVDSNDFIRHNHIGTLRPVDRIARSSVSHSETHQKSEVHEQSTPPALLTTIPPVGISARPTAIVAPAGPTRSMSTLFSSNSSIKKAEHNNSHHSQPTSSEQQPLTSSLIQTSSSAFQPISAMQNALQIPSKIKSAPILMDIPQHKALERGQQLHHVHISHPQSPSVVHLMLREDFTVACRLLHDMAAHADLQADHKPAHHFKAQVNRLCACFHEGRWFRCRILGISADLSTATVVYLDWGMSIPIQIGPEYMRRLPSEFYGEPACSILCHLDGVPDKHDLMPANVIAQCIALLSENEYDVTVNGFDSKTGGKVVLSVDGKIVNDQIQQLIIPNTSIPAEDELVEQFRHEFPLTVGDELKASVSSFTRDDDAFYVLLFNESTVVIDRAMAQLQEKHMSSRYALETPRIKTLVVARYADDGRWYRAWIKSISSQSEKAMVFFVDFGNESSVSFDDIRPCPESIRTLPWLGIRVRLVNETMTYDELAAFWKLAESNYIWIKIVEILTDSYSVQIKLDYTVILRQERLKLLSSPRLVHTGIQAKLDDALHVCPSNTSELTSYSMTPSLGDQHPLAGDNFIRTLFEMVSKELRHLRHRINDSDEASQDRHSQLMELLFSTFNSNNSNSQKKLSILNPNSSMI